MNQYLPEGFIEDNSEELESAVEWYVNRYEVEPKSPQDALDEYIDFCLELGEE